LTINGIPCPPDEFTELFFFVYEKIDPDVLVSLTFFELLALLAFVYFAQKKVDVAIFGVGLGGRLDATNVCQPNVSVITSVSYDHVIQLGPTLADIAAEKSGIIKPGIPIVTTVLHSEPQAVIRNKAKSTGSPLFVLNEHFFVHPSAALTRSRYVFRYDASFPDFPVSLSLDDVSLKMPGSHQVRNASAAISAFLLLHQNSKFNTENIRTGLQNAFIPIRGEVFPRSGDLPTVIFDGAHNRSSIRAFLRMVMELFPNRRLTLIFGASLGKDVEGMFAEISGHFHRIFLTQSADSNRRFPPQGLLSILALYPEISLDAEQSDCEHYLQSSVSLLPHIMDTLTFPIDIDRDLPHITPMENCKDALEQCLRETKKEDVVCITGSLYLAAEVRKYFLESHNVAGTSPVK
jgi:dihydrofolate synthase/folylpolyglutamate synthase